MKIVYVSDNRCRGNYGCRATSTALSQIVQQNNTIVGRISGKNTNFSTSEFFFIQGLPVWVYKKLGKMKYWPYLRQILFYVFMFIRRKKGIHLSKFDFISTDLAKSIKNLKKCIPANPELKEFDLSQYDFDAIVVNGEGSFIFSQKPWRESLIIAMEILWAQKLGKKVFFTNAMFSDDPYSPRNLETISIVNDLLCKCDVVTVREHESFEYAKKYMQDVKLSIIPDALFSWYNSVNDGISIKNGKYFVPMEAATDESFHDFDFSQDYILITGSSATGNAAKNVEHTIKVYSYLTDEVKRNIKMKCYLVEACEGDFFMHEVGRRTDTPVIHLKTPILAAAKILSNAKVYITGRYHPAILASLGGTPCVFMSSNSHKTRSLQELLEYEDISEYSLLPDAEECKRIIETAQCKITQGNELRDKIRLRAKELSINANSILEYLN